MAYRRPADPARKWMVVVPSDTVNLPAGCSALYVGGAGNISLVGADGVAAVFSGALAGVVLPCGPVRVNATGTAATLLLALY